MEIHKRPNFSEFEPRIYKMWEENGYFTPKIDPKKKPFTIMMPPPNANAPLHIGHVMFVTVEDILTRFHRMLGESALWLPGADHAGILTQVVFERNLEKRGKTRYDLGREKFFEECMQFTLGNKGKMENQLRALGASCDWSRNSFTLDPKFDKPIYITFKNFYDDSLIYRGERMINWCPRCQTALSDLEVEHKEEKSNLWYIRYPLKNQETKKSRNKYITVATTRPETMLGDTAVAVNPNDKRYKDLVDKVVILPLINREIPVIIDDAVDPKFGTGMVKVTPAHDPTDFEIGQKNNLESIQVIGFDNKMTSQASSYAGMEIYKARNEVVSDLKKQDLLEKTEDYSHSVGHCERCKTVVEPLISPQWFVRTSSKFKVQSSKLQKMLGVKEASLTEMGILAVKKGYIKIIPKRFEKIYFNWMENIRDWCISRQIWWGHQLPVWYCLACGNLTKDEISKLQDEKGLVLPVVKREIYSKLEPIISVDTPKKCPKCGSRKLYRDPDTLDTWFSSGQWPYTTLGWPDKVPDLEYFYPTSVMETGYEILFFWVARMIMLGIYSMHSVPFKIVYLHGLVRDAFGIKMSKSKGNVIDPLEATKKYGADALRLALILGNAPGTDSSLSDDRIKGMRNFVTKIWNIARFILGELERGGYKKYDDLPSYSRSLEGLTDEDKKIVKELDELVKRTTKLLERYRFDLAAEGLYHFIWHRFADEYIEYSKERMRQKDIVVLSVLRYIFFNCLKLLHPFMPFVTEEIWQKFPRKYDDPIIISKWPEVAGK